MTNPELNTQDARIAIAQDISIDELIEKLVAGNIPVEAYGTGVAKTIPHLLTEIRDGESLMSIDASGNVHREVHALWIDVVCELENGDAYTLKEDRQEFKDGRTKRRTLHSSLGEKLKPGEDPEKAVSRAIQEELGIEAEPRGLYYLGEERTLYTPDTYPGLETSYQFYKYVTMLDESSFNTDGYIEYQADKTNYYVWEQIPRSATLEEAGGL